MTQAPPIYSPDFKVKENCLYYCGNGKNGSYEQKLCNFSPQILSEVIVNDGIQEESRVRVGGIHQSGKPLPVVELPTDEALALNWIVKRWGVDCILEMAPSARERIRYALQLTGKNAEKKMEYAVTGWREIEGKLEFLMPGDDKLTVRLSEKMRGYTMERSCSPRDIQIALRLLEEPPAATEVIYPLLAFTFLSPLNHFLKRAGYEPKFLMLLQGKTGARKSTLAALMLSFFGRFTASELPISCRDTKHSIIKKAFALKDVLTCIDDFHPAGRQEESRMKEMAQHILRSYGDRTGRARLTQNCTLMESQPPQGNAIMTAEMTPDIGESATARMFTLDLRESDVALPLLTEFQREAANGSLQRCMYGYIQWLKESYLAEKEKQSQFEKLLKDLFEQHREVFRSSGVACHGRVPEMVAWLQLGMDLLLMFLQERGGLSHDVALEYQRKSDEILYALAVRQAATITQDKPSHKFIRKLFALLESGQVVLLPKNGSVDLPPFHCIGYEDETFLYLFADLAHKTVRKFCEEQGESFSLSCKALLKALAEEGLLEPSAGQNTKTVRVGGTTKRLLCLYKDKAVSIANHV